MNMNTRSYIYYTNESFMLKKFSLKKNQNYTKCYKTIQASSKLHFDISLEFQKILIGSSRMLKIISVN